MGATDAERAAAVERDGDGPAQAFLAEQAERHGIWIVGGTIPIRDAGAARPSSRSLLIGPDGREAARYDKIHLFDVDIPGREAERYKESASSAAGTHVVTASTAAARIGMTVCYDIRFPALFHRLSVLGADVLVVPAAFTVPTGQVHWQPLLQARAIESLTQDLRSLDGDRPMGRNSRCARGGSWRRVRGSRYDPARAAAREIPRPQSPPGAIELSRR
jgi:nitrilase